MLSRENYTKEHILELRNASDADPSIIERTVFAFGLLEAIQKVHMPFIFKGGTSLMLLLDNPIRLSTDIDIIVEPGTDVDFYVNQAKILFPFNDMKEDIRIGRNNIEKRHFRFQFESPLSAKEIYIILDVVFEHSSYLQVDEMAIAGKMLLNDGDSLRVWIPNKNCILADKLTAFAPHTTGILFDQNKDLEIVKQFLDCWSLCQKMDNFHLVADTYAKVAEQEMGYRGLAISPADILKDTMDACICLMGRGIIRSDEYVHFMAGINGIQGHLFSGRINGESASLYACEIMYLAACIRTGQEKFEKVENPNQFESAKLTIQNARRISYIQKADPVAYTYLVRALRMVNDISLV